MPRLPLILLVLAALAGVLPDQSARAADGSTVLGPAELQKVFAELLAGDASQPKRDIEISHFTATPASLELPPGTVDFRLISPGQVKPVGQQTVIADVLVDGVRRQQIKLSGDLKLYGEVACLTKVLRRQSIIAADDLEQVRRDLSMLGPDLISDKSLAIGKELKTTLQAGAVLYGRLLKEPELVKRGDIVSILAATDSLTITVPGRVQIAGAKGDLIKVKNLMSRKEIYATIIAPGTVQAQF